MSDMSIDQQPVLEVEAISRSFKGELALDEMSFTVPKASLTAILGSAGAGKTTTLRMIAGLDKPDSGRIVLSGQDVAGWEPKDRNVAMIFDNLALYPNKTGYDNIASPLVIRKDSRETIVEKVDEMAKVLQISHILHRLPKTMSGGERQRIALGRALIRSPNLFLLDEPLSSLDAKLRIELRAELRRMQRDHGYTFLMATPDFNEAMAIADTIVMLREGKVVQVDKPQVLYDFPADREVASFIGAPQINLLDALYKVDGESPYIHFAGTGLAAPDHLKAQFEAESLSFELGVRPENLRLVDPADALIQAELVDVESLGPKSVLTVSNDADELRLLVESVETLELSLGQSVGINLPNPDAILAFDEKTGQRFGHSR